ncbi:MAG: ABC transporter substrate-binding protein [Spirochaetales bacterium]|nr:ABC transporter substrate-binding protein [Spirochaetales bacterium]
MTRLKISLFLFFLLLSRAFCTGEGEVSSDNSSDTSLIWTDSRGKEIHLEEAPQKVISLAPNLTETLFALNRGDLLIGRTDYCDYPARAVDISSVGTLQEPNIELIIEREPDLVLASTHVPKETVTTLEQLSIPVAYINGPEDFSGLYEVISGCAALTEAREEGEELIRLIESRKEAVLADGQSRSHTPRVYYALGFGDGGDWTAGKGTFIDAMITMAGGENIVKSEGWSYSREMLVEEEPDLIILAQGNREAFLSLPVYRELSAAQSGQIYEIDENLLVRQGPRLIEGLELLGRIFGEAEADLDG